MLLEGIRRLLGIPARVPLRRILGGGLVCGWGILLLGILLLRILLLLGVRRVIVRLLRLRLRLGLLLRVGLRWILLLVGILRVLLGARLLRRVVLRLHLNGAVVGDPTLLLLVVHAEGVAVEHKCGNEEEPVITKGSALGVKTHPADIGRSWWWDIILHFESAQPSDGAHFRQACLAGDGKSLLQTVLPP